MEMYRLGKEFRFNKETAEEIFMTIFPDSIQECDNDFKKGKI